jgi:hypothetical protein
MFAVQADRVFHNQHCPDIRFQLRLVHGPIFVRFPAAIPFADAAKGAVKGYVNGDFQEPGLHDALPFPHGPRPQSFSLYYNRIATGRKQQSATARSFERIFGGFREKRLNLQPSEDRAENGLASGRVGRKPPEIQQVICFVAVPEGARPILA